MSPSSPRVVICGAGIAGIAAAYYLAVECGLDHVTLVDEGHPLSLTSDKSTEAYRNWWPGPDWTMTAFMNRSIDLIEGIARATDNRINLNRRGYVFATADRDKIPFLETMAKSAEERGGGPTRFHDTPQSPYEPSPERGFEGAPTGADVITDTSLIRRHFPFLAPETVALAHARRAGWLSAQQLGMVMLEAVRARGVGFVKGRVVGFDTAGGRVRAVHVDQQGERTTLPATHAVLAAGPMQAEMAGMIGVDLPIRAERHFKVSFADTLGGMPRNAPMLIWLDEQRLPWSDEERAALAADEEAQWLLGEFPAGVHGRPDGATSTLVLFNHHGDAVDPVFPLPEPAYYAEIALRGMSTMVPGLKVYNGETPRPYIDGGYYMRTQENRPLIGPVAVEGAYISCAYSGFGVMASCAGGELIARYVTEAPLPDYAPAFLLSRYHDPAYAALLERWGDGGQL
ncbi:NAD(P)/FAD-dependent oxidoreductase [Microvirga subterranea]|uniref:Glycine/D-amino acid oxidase-like deaminating enzyme n=1 Tax=Microvirga subterranea TaxID=186651 RepID=A0A370HV73_9HYPH|nr:FAD-binding oxidoreductase [Microvirga subterranea]RDI62210.1 glycine/D-amino acid oxidase-like deaminating enzyme [Microvirga subterranea]